MTSIPPSLVATCSPFHQQVEASDGEQGLWATDRKSTRLNSSHGYISYAVFCLKKKTKESHADVSTTFRFFSSSIFKILTYCLYYMSSFRILLILNLKPMLHMLLLCYYALLVIG